MKKFNRSKILSIFFVMAFLLAAPSGMLVALAKGSKAKIHSARISNSVSIRSTDHKDAKSEMHERKEPKGSGPEVVSTKDKETGVEKITSFDKHESNSNGSNDKLSLNANKGKSGGSGNSGSGNG